MDVWGVLVWGAVVAAGALILLTCVARAIECAKKHIERFEERENASGLRNQPSAELPLAKK